MEYIKAFAITLATALIFMSAIELIAPENSMKKYVKFVLGLILISVMLQPILSILSPDDDEMVDKIKKFESEYGMSDTDGMSTKDKDKYKEESFKKSLNRQCDIALKREFEDREFRTEIQCDASFEEEMKVTIRAVNVGVGEKGIKPVEKVVIGEENIENEDSDKKVADSDKIKKFLAKELDIDKDLIKVYALE